MAMLVITRWYMGFTWDLMGYLTTINGDFSWFNMVQQWVNYRMNHGVAPCGLIKLRCSSCVLKKSHHRCMAVTWQHHLTDEKELGLGNAPMLHGGFALKCSLQPIHGSHANQVPDEPIMISG